MRVHCLRSLTWLSVHSLVCLFFYCLLCLFFFFQAEDGIRDHCVTGVQTCALPISDGSGLPRTVRVPRTFAGIGVPGSRGPASSTPLTSKIAHRLASLPSLSRKFLDRKSVV